MVASRLPFGGTSDSRIIALLLAPICCCWESRRSRHRAGRVARGLGDRLFRSERSVESRDVPKVALGRGDCARTVALALDLI